MNARAPSRKRATRRATALLGLVVILSVTRGARADAWNAYVPARHGVESWRFWWPTVVLERASSHPTGSRSVDETRLGLGLALRGWVLSPHVRALVSPSIGAPHNLAALLGAGVRAFFEVGGLPLSYGFGMHVETRLRDSLWLGYATPLEIGAPLYRGDSAEHYAFIGARRTFTGRLINSYLLDPNGYDNEAYAERLASLRDENAWQVYVSLCFGRRIE